MPRLCTCSLLVLLVLVGGCSATRRAPAVSPTPVPSTPATPTPHPSSAPNAVAGWRLTLAPLARTGRLKVVVETPQPVGWSLPTSSTVSHAEIADRRVSYELAPSSESPCTFELTPDRAVFCGAAVLPTPDDVSVVDVAIRLASDESFHRAAASSYGIGRHGTVRARFVDLHEAGFVFGDVHHATFTAEVGRDHAAWIGFFSFDPRWVAAEAAGVRTAVDRWLGIARPADDPSVGLLLAGVADPSSSVSIRPLRRGALVEAGPSATWDARARLDLTRLWVQRTLGHAVTLDHPQARWWFEEGFAHGVALVVLRELGVLLPEEVAAEVSALLAHQAFADQGNRARASAVRGALVAIAVEGAGGLLRPTLRRMVARRSEGADAVFSSDELLRSLRQSARPEHRARIASVLDAFVAATPISLLAADVDRCARISRRRVHRFELGFTPSDDGERVLAVVPGSAADRAGLTADDTLLSLDVMPGRSDRQVTVVVRRDGAPRTLRFHPRGPARTAPQAAILPGCGPR